MLVSHDATPQWAVKVYTEQKTLLGVPTWSEQIHVVASKEEAMRLASIWKSTPECRECGGCGFGFTETTVVRMTPKPLLKGGLVYAHKEF